MPISSEHRARISRRLFVALVLPQTEDFKLDEPGLRRFVRYYLDHRFAKLGGFIANPEAGENYYMTRAEKRRVLDIVLEETNGALPVFAGTFAWTTPEVLEVARDAKAAGAAGIFVAPPAGCMDISLVWDPVRYPEIWLDQIKAQVDAVDMPIITHPVVVPSMKYGVGMPVETTLKICAEVPNVVGWKMTYSYNGHRIISRALREHAPQVAILCATASLFHEALAAGNFDGSLSGSWCGAMEPMLDHVEAWQRNDVERAREIWHSGLMQLQEYIYSDGTRQHIRYKIAAYLRGLIASPLMRPPMPRPLPDEVATLRALMAKLDMPAFGPVDAAQRRTA